MGRRGAETPYLGQQVNEGLLRRPDPPVRRVAVLGRRGLRARVAGGRALQQVRQLAQDVVAAVGGGLAAAVAVKHAESAEGGGGCSSTRVWGW